MASDQHIHITEMNDFGYPDFDSLSYACSCTAKTDEWKIQEKNQNPKILKFYGIHPWYSNQWNQNTETDLRTLLSNDSKSGIGEIGMDQNHPDKKLQKEIFVSQLKIAQELKRPVTVHIIGFEKEILDQIRSYQNGIPIILHSFSQESYVQPFEKANCYFSVNPRLLQKKEENVLRILSQIPKERLLLESDAPHAGKDFSGMKNYISKVQKILGEDQQTLEKITDDNLRRIYD